MTETPAQMIIAREGFATTCPFHLAVGMARVKAVKTAGHVLAIVGPARPILVVKREIRMDVMKRDLMEMQMPVNSAYVCLRITMNVARAVSVVGAHTASS